MYYYIVTKRFKGSKTLASQPIESLIFLKIRHNTFTKKPLAPLDLAFEGDDVDASVLWLLNYYPKHLGCCHGKQCIWEQVAQAGSIKLVQTLQINNFPIHADCSDGQPFNSLHPHTEMEKFELLHALYPNSLKSRKMGKLVFERCLSNWTRQHCMSMTTVKQATLAFRSSSLLIINCHITCRSRRGPPAVGEKKA